MKGTYFNGPFLQSNRRHQPASNISHTQQYLKSTSADQHTDINKCTSTHHYYEHQTVQSTRWPIP